MKEEKAVRSCVQALATVLILLVGALPLLATPVTAQSAGLPWFDDFDDRNADGWEVITGDAGNWGASTQEYYQSNEGDNGGDTTYGYEMISVLDTTHAPSTDDYMIHVRMKQESGYEGWSGFVFRYTKWQDSPVIEANDYLILLGGWGSSNYLEFWTYINTQWKMLAEVTVDVVPTDWTAITADIRGDTFDFYLNGNHVLDVTDTQLLDGTVGLYTETARVRFDDWSAGIPAETLKGTPSQVDPHPDVTVIFSEVPFEGDGVTTVISGTIESRPDLDNFCLSLLGAPWVYYHISTTAVYTGDITVNVTYDDTGLTWVEEQSIKIHHWQGNQWVDVTDLGYPDTTLNRVRGTVSSVFHLGTDDPFLTTAGGLGINLPYYDDFEDGNDVGWAPVFGNWHVESGEYSEDMIFPASPRMSVLANPPTTKNYTIQAKMKAIQPFYMEWEYGLVFRYQSGQNFYLITITNKQPWYFPYSEVYLTLWIIKDGYIHEPSPSNAIVQLDPLTWNTLTADIRGNTFDFYLNGRFVFQFKAVAPYYFESGNVGLYTYKAYTDGVHFDNWTTGIPAETRVGTPSQVDPSPDVSMTFSDVLFGGETTVVPSAEYPGPDLGNFYLAKVGNFYDITTTAVYTGDISVCLAYDPFLPIPIQENLRIKHWQGNDWVDVTDLGHPDMTNHMVCGTVSSLSWFVLAYSLIDPPEVVITGPASGSVCPMNTPVPFTATFTDTDAGDTHTALWEFKSGDNIISVPGTVTEVDGGGTVVDDIPFITTGVYTVTLTVTDSYGLQGTATTVDDLQAMVVIYDPEGSFVTGGGWYWSSPGGYVGDPGLEGKVNFGFVSKYHKGADVPKGNTEFLFKAGDLNFHSDSYDWLVIAGPRAQFKGTGTINGEGNYAFMLTVIDGDLPGGGGVDRIRMKIWDRETGIMVYDTNVGTDDNTDPLTPLGGGEIKIHKK